MSALMKVIDSFRGQRILEESWSLGDKALEEYNQLLLKQDEQYKELELLRGKLNAVVGAVQTLSGPTQLAPDGCSDCKILRFEGEDTILYCSKHQPAAVKHSR